MGKINEEYILSVNQDLLSSMEFLYQRYCFLNMERDKFYNFVKVVIEQNPPKDSMDEEDVKTFFVNTIVNYLNQMAKILLEKEETMNIIMDGYIRQNIAVQEHSNENIEELQKLSLLSSKKIILLNYQMEELFKKP